MTIPNTASRFRSSLRQAFFQSEVPATTASGGGTSWAAASVTAGLSKTLNSKCKSQNANRLPGQPVWTFRLCILHFDFCISCFCSIPHPRIDEAVGDVDQQIEHQDDHRDEHHDAQDERLIP